MLTSLSVRDLVLIDRLDLAIGHGLCALTGETGAGKSILLDALGLALGGRGDSSLIRRGAAQAVISANFDPPDDHPVRLILAARGLADDDRIVLRRVLATDGRSRAFINDQPVGVALLREVGEGLVEIQGQSGQRGLLNVATHCPLLDEFGGLGAAAAELAAAFKDWRAAAQALADAEEALAAARRDEDYLRHMFTELDDLALVSGEEAELDARRNSLMQGEKLSESLAAARAELTDGRGVDDRIGAAQRLVQRTADRAPGALDGVIEALERAMVETAEAMIALDAAARDLAPDVDRLEATEQRLFALRAAARKHNTDVESLAALRDEFAAKIASIEDGGGSVIELTKRAAAERERFVSLARNVSDKRQRAGRDLDQQVMAELPHLKLKRVVFVTRIEQLPEDAWTAAGAERIRFEIATNPGDTPGPIEKIASGGELSRLMLALKVVLTRSGSAPTLVFDEVDSGIGGAAAAAVGERLARLGKALQVLVVTHSPQVAACADQHLRVVKSGDEDHAVTRVEVLDNEARREEVARMLAGSEVTEAARAAADSLIDP